MRRSLAVVFAVSVLGLTVVAPAAASLEDDLREARLELQSAVTDLEAATWDHRIASDTGGLMQFEHDELLEDAALLIFDYEASRDIALARSLEVYHGPGGTTWAERSVAGV